MGNDKKRLDIDEMNHEEDNIYGNFLKEEVKEENINPNPETSNNEEGYTYKEKEYKTNTLEENTKVTTASKFSRVLLFGFYLILILLGVGAFFMIRSNKYEFYLKQDKVLINTGSTYQVELIAKNPRYFDYTNYNYSIENEKVAKVDEFGTVTAIGHGETKLKISLSPGFTSKTMTIVTDEIEVSSVELEVYKGDKLQSVNNVLMDVNQSITIKPIVNNNKELNITGKYSSSDTNIAVVDNFGNVTAKKEGKVTITGEVNGVEGSITIEVKKGENNVVTPPTDKPTSTPTSTPTNTPTNKPTITPTNTPTNKPTITPTVKPVIKNIHMSSSSMSIKNGSTVQLTAIITPQELSSSTLTWSSSNTKVATVNNKGLVTAKSVGKATITAKTSNGLTAKCEITVTSNEVKTTSIILNKTSLTLKLNDQYQLVATISPSTATVRKLIWTSDNENVAEVNQSGLVVAKGEGKATIMVTSSDGKAIAKSIVTVTKASTPTPNNPATPSTTKPTSVSLGIANQTSKYVGEQLQLSASVTPSSIKNYTVKWSSSNTSVATVSNGLVKCVGTGTVTITAEVNGVKGSATIVVKTKPTTTPAPQTAPAGTQFTSSQIKLDKTSVTVSKGSSVTFTISVTKAAGTVKVTTSNGNVKVSLPKGDDDMPICNQSSNICFLDGFTGSDKITVTVTGVTAGTSYVNVQIDDIETSSGAVLTGTGKVGILVK